MSLELNILPVATTHRKIAAIGFKVPHDNKFVLPAANLPSGENSELLTKMAKLVIAFFVSEDAGLEFFSGFFINECTERHPTASCKLQKAARNNVFAHTIVKELIGLG